MLPAAESGDTDAMVNLAGMYDYGGALKRDYETARRYYERAAAKGNPTAEDRLGRMYFNGRGVPVDYKRARKHFEVAASKGHADGMYALGYDDTITAAALKWTAPLHVSGTRKQLYKVTQRP